MVVGLGTGTTAYFVIEELARRIREDVLQVSGVPTSNETARLAHDGGIPLADLAAVLDVDIDGADEVDPGHNLTKGGGGAMTREKIVAVASKRLVIVVDESKLVPSLAWPVPVEVLPFAEPYVRRELRARFPGCSPALRVRDGAIFVTDNGNHIFDVAFGSGRSAPARIAAELNSIPGVVEHGLFVGLKPAVYVSGANGVRVLT
jgi:ribose 5-phosphate isomerase A